MTGAAREHGENAAARQWCFVRDPSPRSAVLFPRHPNLPEVCGAIGAAPPLLFLRSASG